MSSLLVIDSNPKNIQDSYSKKLGYAFVENYKKFHDSDNVSIINLYETPPSFLTQESIHDILSDEDTPIKSWAKEFMKFDKYLIISPMWNLGVPAILKAYLDLVIAKNITYKKENDTFIGLLSEKKVVVIGASGDYYSAGAHEGRGMNLNYLKNIFTYLGVPTVLQFGIEGVLFNKTIAQQQFMLLLREIELKAQQF